jgi:hypothetical protein
MAAIGFYEFQYGKSGRLLPIAFVFLGVIVLSMNNTVLAGSKSIAKVVLIFLIASFLITIEPIHYSYIRLQNTSVIRLACIAFTNLIGIFLIVQFLFSSGSNKKV